MDTPNPFTIAAGTKEPLAAGTREPHVGGRPRKPDEEQTPHLARERERARLYRESHPDRIPAAVRKHRRLRKTTSPSLNFAVQDMDRLLEFHVNSPGSYAFPPDSDDDEDLYSELHGAPDDPIDHYRYSTIPSLLERRSNHYDE